MNRIFGLLLVSALLVPTAIIAQDINDVSDHLQSVSVTIKAGSSQGSGVIKTREINGKKVNFVWTAGHVVDGLRVERNVVDPKTGTPRKIVEFKDASIVKQLVENGRRVGQIEMDVEVIKFSDAKDGHDLALLKVRKEGFIDETVEFNLSENIPRIGTRLYHVGSLLGIDGANSMTDGIVSQIGRVYPGINKKIFDQTTCHAFPGSSGGGVYLQDGKYIGMLVRGAGESFNLIVPMRRLLEFAREAGIEWAIDSNIPVPDDWDKLKIEEIGTEFVDKSQVEGDIDNKEYNFKFWIYETTNTSQGDTRENAFRDHINLGVYNTGQ